MSKQLITYVTASLLAISGAGLSVISTYEGKENKAYKDPVGIVTICYGHTKTAKLGQVKSDAECKQLLHEDVTSHGLAVSKAVKVPISQQQYDAMTSFTYNVGAGNFRKSTLLKKLNQGDYCGAAKEFPKWNKAKGKVLKGLTTRRAAEQKLFLEGTKEKCVL